MKYSPHDSIFDSDAYGVDTDSPETAYEILDGMINPEHERKIREWFEDWLMEIAKEYFNTGGWDDEMFEAWESKVLEIV